MTTVFDVVNALNMACFARSGSYRITSNNFYMTAYMHFSYMQWRRQNFSAADRGTQPGHQNLD